MIQKNTVPFLLNTVLLSLCYEKYGLILRLSCIWQHIQYETTVFTIAPIVCWSPSKVVIELKPENFEFVCDIRKISIVWTVLKQTNCNGYYYDIPK